ncbi:MAG: hypothetical protein ACLPKT_15495 [Methylocella sp.]
MATSKFVGIILGTYRLLDNLKREAVAAIVDLGHHRWLRLKAQNGKPADNVTRPLQMILELLPPPVVSTV